MTNEEGKKIVEDIHEDVEEREVQKLIMDLAKDGPEAVMIGKDVFGKDGLLVVAKKALHDMVGKRTDFCWDRLAHRRLVTGADVCPDKVSANPFEKKWGYFAANPTVLVSGTETAIAEDNTPAVDVHGQNVHPNKHGRCKKSCADVCGEARNHRIVRSWCWCSAVKRADGSKVRGAKFMRRVVPPTHTHCPEPSADVGGRCRTPCPEHTTPFHITHNLCGTKCSMTDHPTSCGFGCALTKKDCLEAIATDGAAVIEGALELAVMLHPNPLLIAIEAGVIELFHLLYVVGRSIWAVASDKSVQTSVKSMKVTLILLLKGLLHGHFDKADVAKLDVDGKALLKNPHVEELAIRPDLASLEHDILGLVGLISRAITHPHLLKQAIKQTVKSRLLGSMFALEKILSAFVAPLCS